MAEAPAGWYQDGQGFVRWWSGDAWTAERRPLPPDAIVLHPGSSHERPNPRLRRSRAAARAILAVIAVAAIVGAHAFLWDPSPDQSVLPDTVLAVLFVGALLGARYLGLWPWDSADARCAVCLTAFHQDDRYCSHCHAPRYPPTRAAQQVD